MRVMRLSITHAVAWFTLFLAAIVPSFQLSPTLKPGFDRAVQKASDKLQQVVLPTTTKNNQEQQQQQQQHSHFPVHVPARVPVLVVDGNNVRGIAKFEWGPTKVMELVSKFATEYGFHGAVVVWDHGHKKFANIYDNIDNESVPLAVLFSGLAQRADDVIVKEAPQLARLCNNDWSSLAYVTNDGDLQRRLRKILKQPNSLFDNGTGTITGTEMAKAQGIPLMMDSTRFVALLSQMELSSATDTTNDTITVEVDNTVESDISIAVTQAQDYLQRHATLRKTRYNPRREMTWERCVVAETMRLAFCRRQASTPPTDATTTTASCYSDFANQYCCDLQTRGYGVPSSTHSSNNNKQAVGSSTERRNINFHGPSRLDKKQRRLLQSYVKALQSGRLDSDKT